eukprot:TRINITY_DN1429_c11_g1_i1.p1 TRINITY_DN1429_c11_g1~~TRINITY_DN1429_c11_g1_i1.p1  ORF type:complete len:1007 (+),score=288.57 TRINITY_DN1429_c11_g1_i1:116-3136(+)
MAAPTKESVLQAISVLSNSIHTEERRAAESFIGQCYAAPGCAAILVDYFLADGAPVHYRQLSGLLLKKLITERWCGVDGDDATAVPDADKQYVRERLPQGLFSADKRVSTTSALCVAAVSATDFPEVWPGLMTSLAALLSPEQPPHVVASSVVCMRYTLESIGDEQSIPHVCDTIVPPLCAVLQIPGIPAELRCNCLTTFDLLVQSCTVIATKASELPPTLRSVIPHLASGCVGLLGAAAVQQPAVAQSALSLLNMIVYSYAGALGGELSGVTGAVMQSLKVVSDKEDEVESSVADEGDAAGYPSLVQAHVDLIKTFLKKKQSAAAFAAAAGLQTEQGLSSTLATLRRCAWLTADDIRDFQYDCAKYIDEEAMMDEGYSGRCRDTILEICGMLCRKSPAAVAALSSAAGWALSGGCADWREAEAALLLFSAALARPSDLKKCGFAPPAFFQSWIAATQACSGVPLLAARCYSVLARVMDSLQREAVPPDECAAVCFQCVADPSAPHVVRTSACNPVGRFQRAGRGAQFVPAVVSGLRDVIRQASAGGALDGGVLDRYLDTLQYILTKTKGVDVDVLPAELFALWQRYHSNPYAADGIGDLFAALAANPSAEQSMGQSALPSLFGVLSQHKTLQPGVLETAVYILTRVVAKANTSVLGMSVSVGVPAMAQICRESDDRKTAQGIAACLRTVVQRLGGAALASVTVQIPPPLPGAGTPTPALSLICGTIAHSFSGEEASLTHSGKLVLQVLHSCADQLSPDAIASLFSAVLLRIYTSQSTTVVQELLLPVAAMACCRTEDFLSFLQAHPTPTIPVDGGERTGCPMAGLPPLHAVLQAYVARVDEFFGPSEMRLLLAGLIRLFAATHAQLAATGAALSVPPSGHSALGGKKKPSQSVPACLAVFTAVGKLLVSVSRQKDDGVFEPDHCSSDEEEEEDDGGDDEGAAAEPDADSEDSEEAGDAAVRAIAGDAQKVVSDARSTIAPFVPSLAPQALAFLSQRQQMALRQLF